MCSTHTQRSHRALGRECCPNYNFVEKVSYASYVFLCLTHCSSSSFAPRARKRRPMSEEEEEVQDQKQTIDAKCKARTQRALP